MIIDGIYLFFMIYTCIIIGLSCLCTNEYPEEEEEDLKEPVREKELEEPDEGEELKELVEGKELEEPVEGKELEESVEVKELEEPVERKELEEPVERKELEEPVEGKEIEESDEEKELDEKEEGQESSSDEDMTQEEIKKIIKCLNKNNLSMISGLFDSGIEQQFSQLFGAIEQINHAMRDQSRDFMI